jgi:hypothetical protein
VVCYFFKLLWFAIDVCVAVICYIYFVLLLLTIFVLLWFSILLCVTVVCYFLCCCGLLYLVCCYGLLYFFSCCGMLFVLTLLWFDMFLCQRQCELLPSLGVRRLSSANISHFNLLL